MTNKGGPRPGGRSARVQASVHAAARGLLARSDRAAVTIPMIAAAAGVTPSTIYRRWGDLQEVWADLALQRLRPDGEPADTGDGRRDLQAWVEQYADEMSSEPGRELLRDVLAAQKGAGQCCTFTKQQIEVIAGRARARGEAFPELGVVMDRVIAPIVYRILFDEPADSDHIRSLIASALERSR